MHARYGSPFLGRFGSVDPAWGHPKLPQSWNRYAYVTNNPLKFVDPTGEIISLANLTDDQRDNLIEQLNAFTGNTYDVNDDRELVLKGTGIESSETATSFYNELIGSDRVFNVTGISGRTSFGDPETGEIGLNFEQVMSARSKRVDLTTFNLGSTLTHELRHASTGETDSVNGVLVRGPGWTGPVVDFVNSIREERGLPLRSNYVAFPGFRNTQVHFFDHINPNKPEKQYKLKRDNP